MLNLITCTKCKNPKPATAFHRDSRSHSGRQSRCKACVSEWGRAYREANLEACRERYRVWYAANPERAQENRRIWREANPDYHREYNQSPKGRAVEAATRAKWNAANPEKHRAHQLLGNAVRRGDVTKLPCWACGALNVQGHHVAYDLPLDVAWLCKKHHLEAHRLHREIEQGALA